MEVNNVQAILSFLTLRFLRSGSGFDRDEELLFSFQKRASVTADIRYVSKKFFFFVFSYHMEDLSWN